MKKQTVPVPARRAMPVLCSLVITLLAGLLLAACSPSTSLPASPTAGPQASPSAALPEATATTASTATALPGKAWLVTSSGAARLEAAVGKLASETGWTAETRAALQASELTPEVRVVIFDAPPANLSELLAAAPQVQFVVASAADLPAAANLSVIRQRPEYQAFVAGFIASLYAADWRSGGLLPGDGPLGGGLNEAFVNGGRYFCGMCGPGWPLGVYFPQAGVLPAASDGAAWQAIAASQFDEQKVNLFFLSAEAARPEVFSYLQGKDQFGVPVRLMGVEPPPQELQNQWLVTVSLDASSALSQLWPSIAAGQGGQVLDAAIVLEDLSKEETPGVGRLRLVEELLKEIAAGRVYPFTVPNQ